MVSVPKPSAGDVSRWTHAGRPPWRGVAGATLALATLVGLLAAAMGPGSAQAAPAGEGWLALYLGSDGFSPTAPTEDASSTRSVLVTFSTPGLSNPVSVGSWSASHDFTFTTDGVATVWLSSDNTAVITSFDVQVRKGTTEIWRGSTGILGDGVGAVLGTTPVKFEIGEGLRGTTWAAGDSLEVRFIVFAVAEPGTPTDVKLHYGSVQHPTALAAAIDDAGPLALAAGYVGVYLGPDEALTLARPTGQQDLARNSENAGPVALANAAAWSWGKTTTTQEIVLAHDAVFTCWTTMQGSAGAIRGLRVTVVFSGPGVDEDVTKAAGVRTTRYDSATGTPGATRWVFGLNTAGLTLPAGTEIDVKFQIWSTHSDTTGKIVVLYGSEARPAGLILASASGAADPEPTTSESATTPTTGDANATTPSASPTTTARTTTVTTVGDEPAATDGPKAKDLREADTLPSLGFALGALGAAGAVVAMRRRSR